MFGDDQDCNDKSISRSHGLYWLPQITLNSSNLFDVSQDIAYLSSMLTVNLRIHIDSDIYITNGVQLSTMTVRVLSLC